MQYPRPPLHTSAVGFDQRDVDRLLARTGRMCAVCNWRHQVQVHHLIPLERGGTDDIANAIPLCPTCHDAVHASYVPGRTTRQYTAQELRHHLERTVARAAGTHDLLVLMDRVGRAGLAEEGWAAALRQAIEEGEFNVDDGGARAARPIYPMTTQFPRHVEQFTVRAGAAPASITSTCPATILFTADVLYAGPDRVTVQYVWLRSDGALQLAPTAATFVGPGTIRIQTTWTLGDPNGQSPTFQPYRGWAQVQLLTDPPVLSNQASFILTCLPRTDAT